MIKKHTTIYPSKIEPLHFCGKIIGYQANITQFEPPFEIEPTKGEHDFTTCEGCKKNLTELTKNFNIRFEGNKQKKGFPFCCTQHSQLVKVKEFNRVDFIGVPEMVAKKIIYTNQHIINNHSSENWYKEITDYIEYTVESFGQMSVNAEPLYLSDYFFYITDLLERNSDIVKERKNKVLEFLKAYQTPTKTPETDFNILISTYEKWFKIFPFEISFFQNLKPYFEKNCLPIINNEPETNKYSGLTKVKIHTKSSLIYALESITLNLLDKINVPELRKQGAITDLEAKQLEFIEATLKTKTAEITKQFSKGELKYVNALKKWLQIHKDYFNEIKPLVKDLPPQQIEKLSDLITHEKSVKIVDCIKIQYKNIKGKQLKLLLLAFQDLGLLPKERIAQKFYNCCKNEFNWNIASYTAMNDYNFNDRTDTDTFTEVKQYIETIIKTN